MSKHQLSAVYACEVMKVMWIKKVIMRKVLLTGTLFILLAAAFLTGCHRSPDMKAASGALMDAVYKNSPSEYSRLTGIPTADLSFRQAEWLSGQSERFLASFGNLKPSLEMKDRISKFLGMAYVSANYTVQNDGDKVTVTIRPLSLLTDAMPEIQAWTESFNKKNADFAYYELTSQEYADTYYDGLLTLLTSKLSDLHYADPVQVTLPFEKGEEGLYAFDTKSLEDVTESVLLFPDKPVSAPDNK